MAVHHVLDTDEWDKVLGQMLKYHQNISDEIRDIIAQIRKEMNQDLVPKAEERATYGKIVKRAIRSMWALEYEIEDIQVAFANQLGSIDIENLTDDFVEEALLQSKPLQGVLQSIRERQKQRMEEIKKEYGEHINNLEPLKVKRPPKPQPLPEKPVEEKPKEDSTKSSDAAKPSDAAPTEPKPDASGDEAAKPDKPAGESEAPVIDAPEPALDTNQAQVPVEASA